MVLSYYHIDLSIDPVKYNCSVCTGGEVNYIVTDSGPVLHRQRCHIYWLRPNGVVGPITGIRPCVIYDTYFNYLTLSVIDRLVIVD